jgi:hypothetical protein
MERSGCLCGECGAGNGDLTDGVEDQLVESVTTLVMLWLKLFPKQVAPNRKFGRGHSDPEHVFLGILTQCQQL